MSPRPQPDSSPLDRAHLDGAHLVRAHLDRAHLMRALWTLFEPVHALTYFSAEARDAFAEAGVPRYWDGYFAGRAAPLGAVEAAPVVAVFSGFSPWLAGRALPAVWRTITPERAIEVRMHGAAATIRRYVPDTAVVERAADALAEVAGRVDTAGRPLASANAALPVPPDPYERLWQAATTLREHRGDGHVTALVAGGIPGLTTIVLRAGLDLDASRMQGARGWSDDAWEAEVASLQQRGFLDGAARITDAGLSALVRAEELTGELALGPWRALDDEALLEVARLLHPVAMACSAEFPYPNPIGMPKPWDPWGDPSALGVPAHPAA